MVINQLVPEISSCEFQKFTKDGFVVLDFFAEWCMGSIMVEPVINELSIKLREKVKFAKINLEEFKDLADKFEVNSTPTFVFLKDGEFLGSLSGSVYSEELLEKIKSFL